MKNTLLLFFSRHKTLYCCEKYIESPERKSAVSCFQKYVNYPETAFLCKICCNLMRSIDRKNRLPISIYKFSNRCKNVQIS